MTLLDEPSAGLSPVLVDRVLNVIAQAAARQGTAVLLVEQLVEKSLAAADRVYALVQGHIVLQAPTSEANLPQRLERAYFGHPESHADRHWMIAAIVKGIPHRVFRPLHAMLPFGPTFPINDKLIQQPQK